MIDVEIIKTIKEAGDFEWQIYSAAKYYISIGLPVIPLIPNGKSIPPKKYSMNYGSPSKKEETIEKWFHPNEGKFAGWNIGLACGKEGGIFVVDVDKHGEIDGFEELHTLESEFEALPDGPRQSTPNGGQHIIFRWQENGASSTGKIARGIDTRGGTDTAHKGHIVAFPSRVNDKTYDWTSGGEIPFIPQWVMEKMGVSWKKPTYVNGGNGRGNENVQADDIEKQVPIDQVARMLEKIDIDLVTYDDWLRIGQAVHTQYPDNDGLEVWDEWSQKGERYKRGECKLRWSGFDDSGPIRMGSLFFYAKEHGWQPEGKDVSGNKYEQLVEKMNKEFAMTILGGKIKIIREVNNQYDPLSAHFDLLGKDDFRTLLSNERMAISDAKGNPKMVSVADIWLGHAARLTYPRGIALMPDKPIEGYYNSWGGFSVQPREGDCSKFLDHIKEVICRGNSDHYNFLINWMADAVQHPANPKGVAIVMRGEEGAGKGTLADTFGRLFGNHYRHLIDDSHLLGNFNAHMMDAVFVFADEITWGGNKKSAGKLKGLVTESHLIGERKGVDAVSYRNMIHMMIASNDSWVIPAGTKSRRWFVLDVDDSRIMDTGYYDAIFDQLEHGGIEAFLYMLLNMKITVNLSRAPESEALQEQRIQSSATDSLLQWWQRSIEKELIDVPNEGEFHPEENTDWPEVVDRILLFESYERWCDEKKQRPIASSMFYNRMKKYGMKQTRPANKNGSRRYKFVVPSLEVAEQKLKEISNVTI